MVSYTRVVPGLLPARGGCPTWRRWSRSRSRDLRRLTPPELDALAAEIRAFLVAEVARTGGHLGPNLGVVELTIALHRVFDSPRDAIVFDTGHQAYVHKMLTGGSDFARCKPERRALRLPEPRRVRARHRRELARLDVAVLGRRHRQGARSCAASTDRHVVAVDRRRRADRRHGLGGAQQHRGRQDRRLVIVVNDNGRSYAPTDRRPGPPPRHVAHDPRLRAVPRLGRRRPRPHAGASGAPIYDALHGMKKGLKDIVAPQGMFEDLGLKYVGPVDGHDIAARRARPAPGPRLRRPGASCTRSPRRAAATQPRRGRRGGPVPRHRRDRPGDRTAARGGRRRRGPRCSRDEIVAIGERARPTSSAITAAMLLPDRAATFAERFPDRVFDVGIAEQHAVTSRGRAGDRRACTRSSRVYATFLNRAVRPGADGRRPAPCRRDVRARPRRRDRRRRRRATTACGTSSMLQVVPGMRHRGPARRRHAARELLARRSRSTTPRRWCGSRRAPCPRTCRRSTASAASTCWSACGDRRTCSRRGRRHGRDRPSRSPQRLAAQGIGVTVVDPRWVLPRRPALVDLAATSPARRRASRTTSGPAGSAPRVAPGLRDDERRRTPLRDFGIPQRVPRPRPSGPRCSSEVGLTAQEISRQVVEAVARLDAGLEGADLTG